MGDNIPGNIAENKEEKGDEQEQRKQSKELGPEEKKQADLNLICTGLEKDCKRQRQMEITDFPSMQQAINPHKKTTNAEGPSDFQQGQQRKRVPADGKEKKQAQTGTSAEGRDEGGRPAL